ncbi:MAG TPA: RecX family transcriptional regulator [Mobilitalea sp.]|nr:RecX family transcriptional regulator [Mobilitalea sp.]
MLITRLEVTDKSKVNVYIDDEYAFPLYVKDVEKFQLIEGQEIPTGIYEELITDIVLSRAKQKALQILKFMDRTEFELRRKLSDAGYPVNIIDDTISYVYEYGYLNDERFASNYIRLRKDRKSKQVIKSELITKGMNKRILDEIFTAEYSQEEDDPEETAIKKAIAKKISDPSTLTWEEKQKLIASLYRKGFDIEKIKRFI